MKEDPAGWRGYLFFEQINRLHRLICMQNMILKLNPGEMMMLVQVDRFLETHPGSEGVKPSELTMGGNISKPAVSKMVRNLEEKGYLVRTASRRDRRVVYVNLTETGRRSLEEERRHRDAAVHKITECMGAEKMDRLLELMEELLLCAEKELSGRQESYETD